MKRKNLDFDSLILNKCDKFFPWRYEQSFCYRSNLPKPSSYDKHLLSVYGKRHELVMCWHHPIIQLSCSLLFVWKSLFASSNNKTFEWSLSHQLFDLCYYLSDSIKIWIIGDHIYLNHSLAKIFFDLCSSEFCSLSLMSKIDENSPIVDDSMFVNNTWS